MFIKKKLILNVLLYPKVKNSFEIGSGYTTDMGLRAKIIWKKPWINSCGHSLESSFSLSVIEQIFDINYKIPIFRNPIEQYYVLQGGIIHENTHQNYESNIITTNVARYWNYSNNWKYAINLHWYLGDVAQSYVNNKIIMLIYPGINVSRIRQRGEVMPFWGDSQYYSINISNTSWRSDINFIILQAKNIWIRTFFKKHRILVRGNLSWTKTNNLFSVVSLLRFFYSGDCGIRGYKYKSLYFRSAEFFTSVTKLITSAFEYQYNIFEKWWGVIFIDAGEIANDIKWNNFKSGIGIGIRYQLLVGSMRLDIATPLINNQKIHHNKSLYFYVNIGPEL